MNTLSSGSGSGSEFLPKAVSGSSNRSTPTGSWRSSSADENEKPRSGSNSAPLTVISGQAANLPTVESAPHVVEPLPSPGDRIDCYTVRHALGSGGMGAVFLADDPRLDRPTALKLLAPEQAREADAVQRFYQEARAAARLDHENIARVHGIGFDGRHHYIAFEYVDSPNVKQKIDDDGPLSVTDTIIVAWQVARALEHSMERGVVHRDIKPSNILISESKKVKLVDMGLARRFEQNRDEDLTQTNVTLGTFDYISPEQARDPRLADVRSDLYSLGCTLFHLMTGRPPFANGTAAQKLLQHMEETPPDIRSVKPELPVEMAKIVAKLMAKDPARRHQTPRHLIKDLLAASKTLQLGFPPEFGELARTAIASPNPKQVWLDRGLRWGVPAASLLVAVSSVVYAWSNHRDDQSTPSDFRDVTLRPPSTNSATTPVPQAGSGQIAVSPGANQENESNKSAQASSSNPGSLRREVRIKDDLWSILKSAPTGSEIVLLEAGSYVIKPPSSSLIRTGSAPELDLQGRELIIRRDRKSNSPRPKIRIASDARPADNRALNDFPKAILPFVGGKVSLEGLDFEIDSDDHGLPSSLAAISARDCAIRIADCSFIRQKGQASPKGEPGQSANAAVVLTASFAPRSQGNQSPLADLASCDFGPNQVGVEAIGPVAIKGRDLVFRGCDSALRLNNPYLGDQAPAAAELEIRRTTVILGRVAALDCHGASPRIVFERSVVGPASVEHRSEVSPLIQASDPDQLQWQGRGNLYSQIQDYLVGSNDALIFNSVSDFSDWCSPTYSSKHREFQSEAMETPLWVEQAARELLGPKLKPQQLQLSRSQAGADGKPLRIGAQTSPFGDIPEPLAVLAPSQPMPPVQIASNNPDSKTEPPKSPEKPATRENNAGNDMPPIVPNAADPNELVRMPMVPMANPMLNPVAAVPPMNVPIPINPANNPNPPKIPSDAEPIRTSRQLRDFINSHKDQGGTIRIASDAELTLSALELPTGQSWRIVSDQLGGKTRPRLTLDGVSLGWPPKLPSLSWEFLGPNGMGLAMFYLNGTSLELEGLEIFVPSATLKQVQSRSAFVLGSDARLSLKHCIVTVESTPKDVNRVFSIQSVRGKAPTLKVESCLLRSGGNILFASPSSGFQAEWVNSIIGSEKSVILMRGYSRDRDREAELGVQDKPDAKIEWKSVTALIRGGLIRLESSQDAPDIAILEASAKSSFFASLTNEPLFQLVGWKGLDSAKNALRWQAESNGYQNVDTLRRDESGRGEFPTRYDQTDWLNQVGEHEKSPKFENFGIDLDENREMSNLNTEELEGLPDQLGANWREIPKSSPKTPQTSDSRSPAPRSPSQIDSSEQPLDVVPEKDPDRD